MRVALYARVSTQRQAQAQTVEQQLERLRGQAQQHGWDVPADQVFRDDGYSGASLKRPGLDRLRDRAAVRTLDLVVITAPDRLARNYVHQVLLLEELKGHSCEVRFLDRPMSQDPHDQLLLQIRGAVAEYERTLIAERMRSGRQRKLEAGLMLPWTRAPFGYRVDPDRPRDPVGVRIEAAEAAIVREMFDLGDGDNAHYVSAKGAMVGLTRSWATELGPSGITANSVAPGWTNREKHGVENASRRPPLPSIAAACRLTASERPTTSAPPWRSWRARRPASSQASACR